MLGQIANFCPVISRNAIVKGSTSLNDIWQQNWQHFGFQSSGAHFLELSEIKLEPNERPEDLFQRLSAFIDDNLLSSSGDLMHHDEHVIDENMTPTLENTIVVLWLQLINPGLPQLVKQKYGAELRNKTIASIKPEISQALRSLLDELRSIEDTKKFRAVTADRLMFLKNKPNQMINRYKKCVCCARPLVVATLTLIGSENVYSFLMLINGRSQKLVQFLVTSYVMMTNLTS